MSTLKEIRMTAVLADRDWQRRLSTLGISRFSNCVKAEFSDSAKGEAGTELRSAYEAKVAADAALMAAYKALSVPSHRNA